MGCLTVADLPSVPLQSLDIFILCDILLCVVVVSYLGTSALVIVFELLEEVLPDLGPRVVAERIISERQVDT